MDKTPFSVYDFFAYLSSGGVLVFAIDYIFGARMLLRPALPVQIYVLLIIVSYVVGQLIAHFSSVLIEQSLVKKWLGEPVVALLQEAPARKDFRVRIFPGFFKPLPPSTQIRIRQQMFVRSCAANGAGLFFHCYVIATATNDKLQGRLDDFRNQYGFARNMAFSFFCVSLLLFIAYAAGISGIRLRWGFGALAVAAGMIYRYLKFFRQYTFELLLRYSELDSNKS
jgi:hypothetical protein